MSSSPSIDGVLVEWGERLFYPGNRIVTSRTPSLGPFGSRADVIRSRIEATVRRAPQVMVKVTGGGRGMKAIAAHFRYITKNGRLEIEDDRGAVEKSKKGLQDIERQRRYGGAYIDDVGHRREAFNIMLSMPHGTDPTSVLNAAREFAKVEFADHRYVMVLHTHQGNPHVHLSVKAASNHGQRLNPRKADLHRWRETFAERLREWGVDAEATRQAVRGVVRNYPGLWRKKAVEEGREREKRPERKTEEAATASRRGTREAWAVIAEALRGSTDPADQRLALGIERFMNGRTLERQVRTEQKRQQQGPERDLGRSRRGVEPGDKRRCRLLRRPGLSNSNSDAYERGDRPRRYLAGRTIAVACVAATSGGYAAVAVVAHRTSTHAFDHIAVIRELASDRRQ